MAQWIALIFTIGEETIAWLGSMQLMGVSLAGIIVGFFLVGFVCRAILFRV